MRSQPWRAFCARAFLMDFLAGYLFCLTALPPAFTIREECDERTGQFREDEAGEDREPLHHLSAPFSISNRRWRGCALATVPRSNCTCSFPHTALPSSNGFGRFSLPILGVQTSC